MGTRFDKEVLALFDELCRKHAYTRTQALEFLVINAIVAGHIPPKNQGISIIVDQRRQLLDGGQVPATPQQRPRFGVPTAGTDKRPVKQRHPQKAV